MGVPIYLFTGFLESGKTSLVKETLADESFNTGEKTLLLCFEEGIEEYDKEELKNENTVLVLSDDFDEGLNIDHLNELNDKYTPERVMIEYNGTWEVTRLLNLRFPQGWEFAQIIATVDTTTFNNYLNNMRSIMYEQLRYADLIIFNRYTSENKKSYLRSSVRSYNRSAQIIYENMNNEVEQMTADDLPFDMSKEEIEITPEDYGIWYMDALDHARNYENKTLSFTAQAFPTIQFGNEVLAVGRYAMVCCANDRVFLGMAILDNNGDGIKPGSWVKVKGKVQIDYDPDSNSDYISLINSEVEKTEALEQEDVIF